MLKDKFLRGSALLFAAMMVGNIFGYLFQLAMGRMLSVEAYGEMNALMSLLVIFGIPFGTLINFFARETAVYSSMGNLVNIRGLHRFGLSRTCWVVVPIICLLSLSSPVIGGYLGVTFDKVLLILGCTLITALATVNRGIIQGMQYFLSLSLISFGSSVLRFAFAVVFVWMGWGIYGALGGLLATGLSLWGYSQRIILSSLPSENRPFHLSFKEIYKHVGRLCLANAFFGVMT